VVADSNDYYPADRGGPSTAPTPPATPGTGKPDDSNGKCRLFAPELPDPECCERQLGFDVETVKHACGLKMYLGESFHATCGYYFLPDVTAQGVPPTWFRLSTVSGATPQDAAAEHDKYTRTLSKDPSFASVPMPGIPGVYWSAQDELNWAFLPGWPAVRRLTWQTGGCSEEGLREVIRQLVTAPEVVAGTPRASVIPTAAPTAPAAPAAPSAPVGATAPSAAG